MYLDCHFIDKLYYEMNIQKLVAFLRKDTFFILLCGYSWIFKFTHVSNTPNSIRENFIQAINSQNNSSHCFTLNDLTVVNCDKNNDLFVFHMNINSLQYHFDELQTFLSNCLIDFQILGISESRQIDRQIDAQTQKLYFW